MSETLSIENSLRGIDIAFEQIESINKLRQVIAKHDTVKLSNEAITIIKLTSNNILSNLRLNGETTRASMESLTTSAEVHISLEGLVDTIWEAIKKTFKALWDMITYLFRSQHRDISKAQDNVKQMPKQIQTIKDNLQSGKQELPADEYLDVRKPGMRELLRNLSYLGDDIDIIVVLEAMQKLTINVELIRDLVSSLKNTLDNFIIFLNQTDEKLDTDYISGTHVDHISDIYASGLSGCVNDRLPLSNANLTEIERYRNLRVLDGFINGDKAFFYNPPKVSNNRVYLIVSPGIKPDQPLTKIKAFKIEAFDTLHEHDDAMVTATVNLTEEAFDKLRSMQSRCDRFLNSFDKEMKSSGPAITALRKELVNSTLKDIVTLTQRFSAIMQKHNISILAYNNLVKMNVEHYKKH